MTDSGKIKCLIVDDEPIAIQVIKNHLSHFAQFEVVSTASNALKAFEYLRNNSVDLMFLDIQMPQLSGIDFARSLSHPPKLILTTAYRQFAADAFEIDAIDYLLKPISLDRFVQAINRYLDRSAPAEKPANTDLSFESASMFVKDGRKHIKLFFKDIRFLESQRDYVCIHTADRKVMTKMPLQDLEAQLPDGYFIRIHKSFVIAIKQISAYTAETVEIGGEELPIGRVYKKDFFERVGKG